MKKTIPIFIIFISMFPLFVFAESLVPCGVSGKPPCTMGCFFVMISNIINFLLFQISLPLTATAFMVAGIMLILGGSEKTIARGKDILKFTFIGMLLAFGAWLMIDLILRGLLRTSYLPWNKFPTGACTATQYNIPSASDTSSKPAEYDLTYDFEKYTDPSRYYNVAFDAGIDVTTDAIKSYMNPPAGKEGETLSPTIAEYKENLDQQQVNAIKEIVEKADLTNKYNSKFDLKTLVDAIILSESSGRTNVVTTDKDGKQSYGLMQVRADTARFIDPSVRGLSDQQIGDKLVNDPQYNRDIGTKYYTYLLDKYGGDWQLASAAYNGGPMANKPSVNCPGSLRWQCEWDNNEHTLPNTGYAPTRKYIDNIGKYYNRLK